MFTSDFATEIESRQAHSTYVTESDAYRMILRAQQDQRRARRVRDSGRYRLIERFGARLIALGRTLCERRGAVSVEIAFHAEHGAADHRPDGRHVA